MTKAQLLRQAQTKLKEARRLLDDAGEQRLSYIAFELVSEVGLVNDAFDQAGSESPHPGG